MPNLREFADSQPVQEAAGEMAGLGGVALDVHHVATLFFLGRLATCCDTFDLTTGAVSAMGVGWGLSSPADRQGGETSLWSSDLARGKYQKQTWRDRGFLHYHLWEADLWKTTRM